MKKDIPQRINVKIDRLKLAFLDAKERMLSERDAIKTNLTNTFFSTIQDKINHGELVVIAVRGEVRS